MLCGRLFMPFFGAYSPPSLAHPVIGFSSPHEWLQLLSAPGDFALVLLYGGCTQEGFGPAGLPIPRSTNPRTAATFRLVAKGQSP